MRCNREFAERQLPSPPICQKSAITPIIVPIAGTNTRTVRIPGVWANPVPLANCPQSASVCSVFSILVPTNMAMSAHIAQLMIPRIKPKTNALNMSASPESSSPIPAGERDDDYNNERLNGGAAVSFHIFEGVNA